MKNKDPCLSNLTHPHVQHFSRFLQDEVIALVTLVIAEPLLDFRGDGGLCFVPVVLGLVHPDINNLVRPDVDPTRLQVQVLVRIMRLVGMLGGWLFAGRG